MRTRLLIAVLGSTFVFAAVSAMAQPATAPNPAANPPASAATPPGLELTPEQRQLIMTSVSSRTSQSTAAPDTFHPAVGATVPPSVETSPLPDTLAQVMPRLKGYEFAMVSGQVLIIDPTSKQVVELIVR